MANQPKTPVRTFRVDDDLWFAVMAKAEENGETVTDVLTRAMKQYLRDYPGADDRARR